MARLFFVSCAAVAFVFRASGVKGALADALESPVANDILSGGASQEQRQLSAFEHGRAEGSLLAPGVKPRRLSESSSTSVCTVPPQAKTPISVEIGEYSLQAEFQCGGSADSTKFVPACTESDSSTKCCTTDACTTDTGVEEIATYLSIKGGSIKKKSDTYTITLDEMPTDRSKKMYYVCNDGSNTPGNKCVVTVGLPERVPGPTECTPSKTVRLDIAKAAESVDFVCTGDGSSLAPEGKVYLYTGKGCGTDQHVLTTLLPEAKFGKKAGGVNTLTVPKLPTESLQLCYVCNYKNPSEPTELTWKPCTIVVSVAGTEGSATSTTNPTTSSSAGVPPAVLGLSAFVILLFSTSAH